MWMWMWMKMKALPEKPTDSDHPRAGQPWIKLTLVLFVCATMATILVIEVIHSNFPAITQVSMVWEEIGLLQTGG